MKENIKTALNQDGFKGYYYEVESCKNEAVICLTGLDGKDPLSNAFVKYFLNKGLNVLSVALNQLEKPDTGVSLWDLEYIEKAIAFLKDREIEKIAMCGISMQAAISLAAASYFHDISMVIAFSPADYIPWGFMQGLYKEYKKAEWPTGKSLLRYRGEALPYLHSPMEKKEYWAKFCKDTAYFHEQHSKEIFELAEENRDIEEDMYIKAENIKGRIVLIGAHDDSMWDSKRYIKRMTKRLKNAEFAYPVDAITYDCGTHLLVPRDLLNGAFPMVGSLIYLMYNSGRKHFRECARSRVLLEERLNAIIEEWK